MRDTPHKIALASLYLVTPEPRNPEIFLRRLETLVAGGISLVQLRAKTLDEAAYVQLARRVLGLCDAHGAQLLLNASPAPVKEIGAAGVHLTGDRLMQLTARPLGDDHWVAASCHDEREVDHAGQIGADFIVVGPVLATVSHPRARLLGWDGLKRLAERAAMPVYALGGLTAQDVGKVKSYGAQGVAAISGLWEQKKAKSGRAIS